MENEKELALVERAVAGEAGAFDELMVPIEPDLRRYLRSSVRSRPEVEVEDALQDVRVYLFERLDKFNPAYPFRAFVFALAKQIVKRVLYAKSDLAPAPSGDDEEWSHEINPAQLESSSTALRDSIGDGRFEHFGDRPEPSGKFLQLLEVFLMRGGYPHQQVSFGYSILLWGKQKRENAGSLDPLKVPVTGEPDRVVREVGPLPLSSSVEMMIAELEARLALDASFLESCCHGLRARLRLTVGELFSTDGVSRKTFARLLESATGETALEQYFGKHPSRTVADWTRVVKSRVKTLYEKSESVETDESHNS